MGESRSRLARALHHGALVAILAVGLAEVVDLGRLLVEGSGSGRWSISGLWAGALPTVALATLAGAAALVTSAARWWRGSWASLSLAPFRWLFDVAVLSTAASVLAWEEFVPPVAGRVVYAGGYGVFAAGLLLGPALAARVPARSRRVLDLLLFQVCLLPVLAEGGLRMLARVRPSGLLDPPGHAPLEWLETHRMKPGALRFGFPVDSRGNYDVELDARAPGTRLVVCIGDSFSAGIVPHRYHYTTVAEGALEGVEIYNLGVPAVGPWEYLHLLRHEALPLEPERIVVALFLGNDVPPRPGGGWTVLVSRPSLLLFQVPRRLARLRAEQDAGGPGHRVGEVEGADRVPAGQTEEELVREFPWLVDPRLEHPTFSFGAFRRMEIDRALQLCRPGKSDFRPLYETLEAMLVAAGDTPLAFLLIPDEFQVEDEVWGLLRERRPDQELDRFLAQREIVGWLEQRGVPHLDLLPLLRAVPPLEDGRVHLYHLQDSHFNVRGNRVVGEALAAFLAEWSGRSAR